MYVLHFRPDTAALIVRLVLEELGQPYRAALIDRDGGELDSPAYRALNPLGQIPALETPQGPMFETAAILVLLTETHGALAPRPGAPGRGDFLKWLAFTSFNLHAPLMGLFHAEQYTGTATGNAGFHAACRAQVVTALALLDGVAAGAPDWFAPDRPSALGYYVMVLVRWLKSFAVGDPRYIDFARYPALAAMARTLEVRPAAHACAAAEGLGTAIFSASHTAASAPEA